jgi:phospholipid-transporting ATPase
LLVEAGALKYILEDDSLTIKRYFLKIAKTCEAVICCRVSPAQKADVVKLIKDDDPKLVTLAIGDGANDCSMILEAHIGVGLYGNEGMRAVQSGDYALGEFQFLWRLILVHGRWAYIRNCELILYFFYKNIVFTLPQVFYAFVAAYSGVTVYDDWYISFYNLFFTSMPLMVRALFDQDINTRKDGHQFKKYLPKLYYIGQRSIIFNVPTFLEWLFFGVLHSVVVFLIPLFIY